MKLDLDDRAAKSLFDALSPFFTETQSVEVCKVPGQGEWTQLMVEKLALEVEPYRGAVALLDFASSRAGEEIRYSDVKAATGLEDMQLRTDLGAMSKVSRTAFDRKTWPLRAWQAGDGEMRYQMPQKTAQWWHASRKKQASS